MKKTLLVLAVTACCSCTFEQGRVNKVSDPLEYVDTEIGGVGVLLQPTRPTVQIPNQLIRWSPLRADLLDVCIYDYPLTLTSHRQESVFGFLPLARIPSDGWVWEAGQVYDNERNTPYGYRANLEGCNIKFSCAPKSGIAEIHFESDEGGFLRFRILNGKGSYHLENERELTGEEEFHGMKAYVCVRFESPVTLEKSDEDRPMILLSTTARDVRMRYAISYISKEKARTTLDKEIPNFDLNRVRENARSSWEKALGRIRIKGGSEKDIRLFYSSLYRCYERMVDINEYGSYFSAFDNKVHQSDDPFYTDNWLWDTYVSLEPLMTILDPDQEEDKLRSYVEMYKQCGVIPSFAVIWGDWPAMTGNYAAVWMADSRAKGLDFDLGSVYKGLKDNSLESTLLPWKNGPRTVLDDFYNEHGWFPALHPGEEETVPEVMMPWERRQAVSLSTAFSYADWATAQLARELGKEEDVDLFLKRAAYYKNVYRPDKGMFWPRDKEGNWIEGVDPRYMDRAYYTENNAYTFQWDVKHDLEGLIELMGGREEAEKKLDELFRIQITMPKYQFYAILPDATGMMGQFAMGNEPSFHIPYIYNYLGSPWKTQKRIRTIIDRMFSDTVYGIPGDEDGGGMSSFLVFTMMGFFPVTPGIPVYAIGCPFFEEATINLPGDKKFTVKARGVSKENKYIQSARLNGKPLERSWFTHKELTAGGVLELKMGSKPCKEWASDPAQLPPSSINYRASE